MIALLTLGVMMAVERRVDYLTGLRPIIGLVILTSLVLPWVLMVTSATDGAFLSIAVKGDLVSKLQSGQESHGAPPLTYLMIIILTFWPGELVFCTRITDHHQSMAPEIYFILPWLGDAVLDYSRINANQATAL